MASILVFTLIHTVALRLRIWFWSSSGVVCPAGAQQIKHCDVVLVTICYKRAM